MIDPKVALGAVLTMSATAASWMEQANAWGQLVLTGGGIIVAILTAWYTYERILSLRNQRKEAQKLLEHKE
jgi:uncharacterized membrane protein